MAYGLIYFEVNISLFLEPDISQKHLRQLKSSLTFVENTILTPKNKEKSQIGSIKKIQIQMIKIQYVQKNFILNLQQYFSFNRMKIVYRLFFGILILIVLLCSCEAKRSKQTKVQKNSDKQKFQQQNIEEKYVKIQKRKTDRQARQLYPVKMEQKCMKQMSERNKKFHSKNKSFLILEPFDLSLLYQMSLVFFGVLIGSLIFRKFNKEKLESIVCVMTAMMVVTIIGSAIIMIMVNLLF